MFMSVYFLKLWDLLIFCFLYIYFSVQFTHKPTDHLLDIIITYYNLRHPVSILACYPIISDITKSIKVWTNVLLFTDVRMYLCFSIPNSLVNFLNHILFFNIWCILIDDECPSLYISVRDNRVTWKSAIVWIKNLPMGNRLNHGHYPDTWMVYDPALGTFY